MGPARKTVLNFGLVSIPVGLVPCARSERESLRLIAPPDDDGRGVPVREVYLDATKVRKLKGEEVVPLAALHSRDECGRGVPVGTATDGSEILLPVDAETYRAAAEPPEFMELLGFVPARDYESRYADRARQAHYLQPQQGSAHALGTLWRTMRTEKAVGVVRFAIQSRERLGVLVARSDGAMTVRTLEYAARWKEPDAQVLSPGEQAPNAAEKRMARELVRALTVDPELLDAEEDGARERQREVLAEMTVGAAPPAAAAAPPDLMAQLEASVESARRSKRRRRKVPA